MSFLDKSQAIFVDAVLTDRGRQLLSKGENLNIIKFALSDDGVDYGNFDVTDTRGPDYFDATILGMPVLEAFTRTAAASEDGTSSVMKTLLTSELNQSRFQQEITGLPDVLNLEGALSNAILSPTTLNLGGNENYTITLSDNSFVDMYVEGDTIGSPYVTTGRAVNDPGSLDKSSGAARGTGANRPPRVPNKRGGPKGNE
jgi:hypothetical protein